MNELESGSILTGKEWKNHASLVRQLPTPVVILGAGGFIGSLATHILKSLGVACHGFVRSHNSWRLKALKIDQSTDVDLRDINELSLLLTRVKPRLILNFSAVGSYPSQQDSDAMIEINICLVKFLAEWCSQNSCILVHSGSSSEYGTNCDAPSEYSVCDPNSHYSITKLAGTHFLKYVGDNEEISSAVLRFYSVFGPLEEPTRLIPTLVREGLEGRLPMFSPQTISRDFVFVVDAIEAVWRAAIYCMSNTGTHIFNIGSGVKSTMVDISNIAKRQFGIADSPVFQGNLRKWDLENWVSNPSKAARQLGWRPSVNFYEGLKRTSNWYQLEANQSLLQLEIATSRADSPSLKKISVVIACYRDALAIPIMYKRLVEIFRQIGCSYEIIFVNDSSPDDTRVTLETICNADVNVIAITHSRNFGSQAAFLSGLEISSGDACVLMDGDLQDPPELIAQFYLKWVEGFEVVYGIRETREASLLLKWAYRQFYRILDRLSPFRIPRDAGDFSLMSRPVVDQILGFPERGLFVRTSRAFIGGRQIGIPYHRPERMFGQSTNNFFKNLQWAIQGVLSVSRKPLTILGVTGILLSTVSGLGLATQLLIRIVNPNSAPPGLVSVILLVGLFGSLNLLAISVVGEYIGRILEEVRNRPRYIRSEVRRGSIK